MQYMSERDDNSMFYLYILTFRCLKKNWEFSNKHKLKNLTLLRCYVSDNEFFTISPYRTYMQNREFQSYLKEISYFTLVNFCNT